MFIRENISFVYDLACKVHVFTLRTETGLTTERTVFYHGKVRFAIHDSIAVQILSFSVLHISFFFWGGGGGGGECGGGVS